MTDPIRSIFVTGLRNAHAARRSQREGKRADVSGDEGSAMRPIFPANYASLAYPGGGHRLGALWGRAFSRRYFCRVASVLTVAAPRPQDGRLP